MTECKIKKWAAEYEKIQDEYGNENDGDYYEFDTSEAIKSAADKIGIEFKYPRIDYTIII